MCIRDRYKRILYAMEARSEHPLAEAVVDQLKEEGVQTMPLDQFESVTGQGVRAVSGEAKYFIGNKKLMDERGISVAEPVIRQAEEWQQRANTVVDFAREKEVLAIIAIADEIKLTSKEAIETMQDRGIEVYMLTGDNRQTAAAVADQVGLKHFEAEVMPSERCV